MLLNQNIAITCDNVILVPYRPEHVEKYHSWMNSEKILELTASERLTLKQEKEMQHKWLNDEDKCTFIVLDALSYSNTKNEISSMIGDTNLFLSKDNFAEAEIMIAEESFRGFGRGKNALLAMLRYGIENLQINTYVAKIGKSNIASLKLFEKIGFVESSYSDVFKEFTLILQITNDKEKWIIENTLSYDCSCISS